jgi:hypothetical protein
MSENINECSPITIFPMGVECVVTNPTNAQSSDGSATLIITGGTPPYDITWDNGSKTITITNLSSGSYPATIVDYYGDFTVSTVCVLVAPTTTTSTTTTTTTLQPTYDFCMAITYYSPKSKVPTFLNIHFNPNGYYNGYPTWISDNTLYSIIWDTVDNRWELVDTVNNLTVINNNPAYPPLTGWQILGLNGSIVVYEGECGNTSNLRLEASVNYYGCDYKCLNSITITGSGGTPPYQYSIDGGVTWSNNPIFQNLCNGLYSPKIKDSMNTVFAGSNINLVGTPC